ncbi:MAG TPA: histidine phosphatase family protein [Iamia sp.]
MRLILVRHGEAHAGFHGPIAGPTGGRGLTPLGRRQAEALRDHLRSTGRVRADLLVTSVLPRAIETATIVGPGLGLEVSTRDCDLCEVHTGEADGVDWADYNARFGSFDMEAEPDRIFAPGGDSWNGFHDRVQSTLERLAREHADRTVVAVCHAGVIMASIRLLLGMPSPGTSAHLRPTNTGLTEWEHDPDRGSWILRSYNEADHLLGLTGPAHPDDFSTASARQAAACDDLGDWVRAFLASPGSDNAELAAQLSDSPRCWIGPVEVPLDQLHRLAGPPDHPVLEPVADHEWRDDVEDLADEVVDGHEPPPVVATFSDDRLVLEDGNHRVEALRRAGVDEAWTVIGFEDADARDRFIARSERTPS